MRRKFIFLLILANFLGIVLAQEVDKWQTAKSTHFIIYYQNVPEDFLNRVIKRAEDYYDRIADNLGFRRYDFWLWDNRAKIYIYDDALGYQAATGQPSWSVGATIPKDKIIHAFPNEYGFFDSILPHEMGHIIFREFVGFENPAIPLWLDEGVASYQEAQRRAVAPMLVKEAIRNNSFMDLEKLSNLNPRSMPDEQSVNLFYAQSLSIVDFLIKEFGSDNFVLFCQGLRDKRDLERALAYAYPFRDLKDFNRAWQNYIKDE